MVFYSSSLSAVATRNPVFGFMPWSSALLLPLFYNSQPFRVTFLAKPRASAAQFNLSLDGQMMLFERADLHYLGISNRELYFCVIDHTGLRGD